jgi:hypothetical protein
LENKPLIFMGLCIRFSMDKAFFVGGINKLAKIGRKEIAETSFYNFSYICLRKHLKYDCNRIKEVVDTQNSRDK